MEPLEFNKIVEKDRVYKMVHDQQLNKYLFIRIKNGLSKNIITEQIKENTVNNYCPEHLSKLSNTDLKIYVKQLKNTLIKYEKI